MNPQATWRTARLVLPEGEVEIAIALLEELQLLGAIEEPGEGPRSTRVVAYFPEASPRGDRLRATIQEAFAPCAALAGARIEPGEEHARDWSECFREHFKPFAFVPGVVIVPSWERYTPAPGEIVIAMDPGMAFGTGLHETTALCGEALLKLRSAENSAPRSLLDMGTGSGILAILGQRLGMRPIAACDNDLDALEVARENCNKNGCADIELFSDLRNVRSAFDVVVANILLGTLVALRGTLERAVAPGGFLILSGILQDQEDALLEAYAHGFQRIETARRGEWSQITLRREA